MLGEDSDYSESDDESSDADVEEVDLEEINSILSDQEMPSPEDSFSDEDNELDDSSSTGEIWTPLLSNRTVRTSVSNLVRVKSGVNPAIRRQAGSTPYECWKLFVDTRMLKNIQANTTREAKKSNPNFSMALERLEAFIGLQYARGIYGKSHPLHFLWNNTYGPRIFPETMSRACFMEVNRFLRFDNKDQRSQRLTTDKFVHIRETLEDFVSNCQYNYAPEWSLPIDEQLFPMKNRCPFIVFMLNKPDKFGMKFWVLAEVKSKYVCNLLPYLGALEKKPAKWENFG